MKTTTYKNILKSISMAFVGLFALTSCNDFLDVEPVSKVSPEKYFTTADQLKSYVDAYYANYDNWFSTDVNKGGMLPSHYGTQNGSPYYDDAATDNNQGTSSRYVKDAWTVGSTGGYWNFTNIYALNYFINSAKEHYAAGNITGSDADIKHYMGEGYFLRALEYYFRLRRLGDFPIITENLPDDQDVLTAASQRRPRNEVARFIIQNLDTAITYLSNSKAKTRISKNAALILKSRVALYEGTWEKYHAGTALVPNGSGWPGAQKSYLSGYSYNSQTEINYFLSEAMDAASQVADAINLAENNKIERQSSSDSKNPYYDMFASHDPTGYDEVVLCRLYSSSVGITHHFNHYMYSGGNTGYTHQYEQSFLMENGLPVYAAGSGYAGDDYIADTKQNRDWRWRLFMKAPGDVKAVENVSAYEYFPTVPYIYAYDMKAGTSTGYIQGKGHSLNYNDQVLGQDETAFVVYRAGEAYLNYIEASYEKNGSIDSKADKYWRALRTRAGVDPDYNKTINATDMTKEAENDWGAYSAGKLLTDKTLYNIRRERRCEFIGEGFRLDDLYRWRALDQLNGFQLEGCKVFGPMLSLFQKADGSSLLVYDQTDESKNNISSPSLSLYMRPNQKTSVNNLYYNGFYFYQAHYLEPIAVQNFLNTASDGKTVSDSPIYQNPGWPIEAGATCE